MSHIAPHETLPVPQAQLKPFIDPPVSPDHDTSVG